MQSMPGMGPMGMSMMGVPPMGMMTQSMPSPRLYEQGQSMKCLAVCVAECVA